MFEFADVFPGSLTWLYGSHYLGGNFIRTNNKVGGNRWDSVAITRSKSIDVTYVLGA